MLSDELWKIALADDTKKARLNALSSIVCFLTHARARATDSPTTRSQCPLEHCMLSDYNNGDWVTFPIDLESQCPLEHCMLSDHDSLAAAQHQHRPCLNALSSIVCFLTESH